MKEYNRRLPPSQLHFWDCFYYCVFLERWKPYPLAPFFVLTTGKIIRYILTNLNKFSAL